MASLAIHASGVIPVGMGLSAYRHWCDEGHENDHFCPIGQMVERLNRSGRMARWSNATEPNAITARVTLRLLAALLFHRPANQLPAAFSDGDCGGRRSTKTTTSIMLIRIEWVFLLPFQTAPLSFIS
ncbi:MAG: hypothetical protein ABIW02_00315 [Nitrosospira sp.]